MIGRRGAHRRTRHSQVLVSDLARQLQAEADIRARLCAGFTGARPALPNAADPGLIGAKLAKQAIQYGGQRASEAADALAAETQRHARMAALGPYTAVGWL